MSLEPIKPEQLQAAFTQAAVQAKSGFGPEVRLAKANELTATCARLQSPADFHLDILEDYTALDLGDHFDLVLHLTSSQAPLRHLTLKAPLARATAEVQTLQGLYASAEWYEREIFDMFGIRFLGHPDLRRILLPEDWEGYPLRKDYQDERILKRPGA
jgi:NADH-quinone oxidoreductase subunit C